jgi:hypothetical protein
LHFILRAKIQKLFKSARASEAQNIFLLVSSFFGRFTEALIKASSFGDEASVMKLNGMIHRQGLGSNSDVCMQVRGIFTTALPIHCIVHRFSLLLSLFSFAARTRDSTSLTSSLKLYRCSQQCDALLDITRVFPSLIEFCAGA